MLQEPNVLSFLKPHVVFYANHQGLNIVANVETDFQHYSFGEELFESAEHLIHPFQCSWNTRNPLFQNSCQNGWIVKFQIVNLLPMCKQFV